MREILRPGVAAGQRHPLDPFSAAFLHIRHEVTAGGDGGTFTSGAWRTRPLDVVVTNKITGASLASNAITLPAGTYYLEAAGAANNSNNHKTRIRDTTNSATLLLGETMREPTGTGNSSNQLAPVWGRFTLSGTAVIELQHWCANTTATTGFGEGFDIDSTVEIFAVVRIWKVG